MPSHPLSSGRAEASMDEAVNGARRPDDLRAKSDDFGEIWRVA